MSIWSKSEYQSFLQWVDQLQGTAGVTFGPEWLIFDGWDSSAQTPYPLLGRGYHDKGTGAYVVELVLKDQRNKAVVRTNVTNRDGSPPSTRQVIAAIKKALTSLINDENTSNRDESPNEVWRNEGRSNIETGSIPPQDDNATTEEQVKRNENQAQVISWILAVLKVLVLFVLALLAARTEATYESYEEGYHATSQTSLEEREPNTRLRSRATTTGGTLSRGSNSSVAHIGTSGGGRGTARSETTSYKRATSLKFNSTL